MINQGRSWKNYVFTMFDIYKRFVPLMRVELQLAGWIPSLHYWSMVDYDRIVRECFWDSRISGDDIREIIARGDLRRKNLLFEKILLGSSCYLHDLQIFDGEDLPMMLEEYKLPEFNYDFAFRRKNISEVFFFNKELMIGELKWTFHNADDVTVSYR